MSDMEKMTPEEALHYIESLGYTIDKSMTFNYRNTSNEVSYDAKGLYVIQKDNRLGAFNKDARRDTNYEKLQEFRRNVTVTDKLGRVWEF